jgi:hypothetical protein
VEIISTNPTKTLVPNKALPGQERWTVGALQGGGEAVSGSIARARGQ